MSSLIETEFANKNSDPWLYLNKGHSDLSLSEELKSNEHLSEEMLEYLNLKGINEDTDESVCAEFAEFLKQSKNTCFRSDGYDPEFGACTKYMSGIQDRNNPEYRKRVWAKIQCLNPWYEKHHSTISMITFTTFQRGLTKWEQLELLQSAYELAYKMLNKHLGEFSYIRNMEAHPSSGYAHIHMVVFKDIPRELRQQLNELWIKKYNPGASIKGHKYEQSIHFEIRKGQRDLKSAAAYVFSYIGKSLKPESLQDKNSSYFLHSAWLWKMSRRNTDYKSVRSWSCSRDLSKVMKLPETGSKINWWRFSINVPATYKHKGGWFPLWVDEDMAGYIDRINDFDISLAELDQDSLKTCKDVIFI